MKLTPEMEARERHFGKPLRQLILDLYVEHRNMGKVAKALSVTRGGLWNWCRAVELDRADLETALLAKDHPLETLGNHTA